jgi:hypothetical protein
VRILLVDIHLNVLQLSEVEKNKRNDPGRIKPQRLNLTLPAPRRYRQMYGYCVSEKWLHETVLDFLATLHPELHPREARSNAYSNACYNFKKKFGISSLGTGASFLPPGQVIPAECMCDRYVYVFYICTDQPSNYRWRPTQKQVDELSKLVGREPKWWVDHLSTSFYQS